MVLAYHVIFTAYGFWLPNDPRGSWSDFVRNWELLLAAGPATQTDSRRSVAGQTHDVAKRRLAKASLQHDPVRFDGHQARVISEALAEAGYPIHACSILPTHVHMVLGRSGVRAEQMVRRCKQLATIKLTERRMHPKADSPWARNCWKVYLNTPDDIHRATGYVRDNPIKEGKREQAWEFITPWVP